MGNEYGCRRNVMEVWEMNGHRLSIWVHFWKIMNGKTLRGNDLQKDFYASWEYFLGIPKVRNHENDHFQKSNFFQDPTAMENELQK